MTNEELKHKKLSSRDFTENQLLIYGVSTAISMSFFLALIGAGDNFKVDNILVQICIFLFTISLISNATSAFLIASHKNTSLGRDYIKWLNESKKYSKLFGISVWSFLASIIVLISNFSIFSIIPLIVGIPFTIYYIILKSYKEFIDNY